MKDTYAFSGECYQLSEPTLFANSTSACQALHTTAVAASVRLDTSAYYYIQRELHCENEMQSKRNTEFLNAQTSATFGTNQRAGITKAVWIGARYDGTNWAYVDGSPMTSVRWKTGVEH